MELTDDQLRGWIKASADWRNFLPRDIGIMAEEILKLRAANASEFNRGVEESICVCRQTGDVWSRKHLNEAANTAYDLATMIEAIKEPKP